MQINGKEYEFKYPTIALVKAASKVAKKNELLNDMQKLIEADAESAGWKDAVAVWKEFCELIFANPDDGLSLEKVSPFDITGVATSFFQSAVASQSAPKNSQ